MVQAQIKIMEEVAWNLLQQQCHDRFSSRYNCVGVHQPTSTTKVAPAMCANERMNDRANKKSGKKCKSVENN